jgi:hypothetical protein
MASTDAATGNRFRLALIGRLAARRRRGRPRRRPILARRESRDQLAQLGVAHLAPLGRHALEGAERALQLGFGERETERIDAARKARAARELAQHDLAADRVADQHRVEHLVGLAVLEHAVLMDARGVAKRIAADHGLVGRHPEARARGHLAGERVQRREPQAGHGAEPRAVHMQRGGDFLERRVAGALADPVDGALHLPRARGDRRQRVGGGEAEIVLAVEGDRGVLELGHARAHAADHRVHLIGRRAADGVGQVQRARAGREHGARQLGEELRVRARGVHGRELHVVGELARAAHHRRRHGDHLRARLAELVRELHVARVHEHVDARRARAAQRLAGGGHVLRHRARERAHAGVLHLEGDRPHGGRLLRRVHREARLDHVDAEGVEARGDLRLVVGAEADPGGLLAVAQRRVEDRDAPEGRAGWARAGVSRRSVRTFGIGSHGVLLVVAHARSAAGRSHASRKARKHEAPSGLRGGRGLRVALRALAHSRPAKEQAEGQQVPRGSLHREAE